VQLERRLIARLESANIRFTKVSAKTPAALRYSISFTKDIEELLEKARTLGLEGLVGKRSNSGYEAGKRSGAWIKIKLQLEQEFVIGGYTDLEGGRKHFGALVSFEYLNFSGACCARAISHAFEKHSVLKESAVIAEVLKMGNRKDARTASRGVRSGKFGIPPESG
jgi:hypothetical protein